MITKDKVNKKHILVIEDDPSVTKMLELLLADYHLAIIDNAAMGLAYLRDNYKTVDLILLDNMLPDLAGLRLLAVIKDDDTLRGIPVIIQSGDPDVLSSKRSAILADQILLKPYTKEQLFEAIEKVFK